jgi:hypothetical protein
VLAGLMLGASFIHQESATERDGRTDEDEGDGVDLELAGYLGVATPREGKVRFRAQGEFGVPALRPGQARELDPDLPPLPGWQLSLVLGAEFSGP